MPLGSIHFAAKGRISLGKKEENSFFNLMIYLGDDVKSVPIDLSHSL